MCARHQKKYRGSKLVSHGVVIKSNW
jgi:hypothetical protein